MATFEFVSLTCIRPSEIDGDEVYIEYNGQKVFPGPDRPFQRFAAGTKLVNTDARLGSMAVDALLGGADTHALHSFEGAGGLARVDIPDIGLIVRVMDYDSITSDDELGRLLVSDIADLGVQEMRLQGAGEYVISFLLDA